MKDGTTRTLLIVGALAVVGVLVWLYLRGKKTAATSAGVFGTITAGWNAGENIASSTVNTTLGIAGSAVKGTTSIVKDAMPWNW